MVESMHNVENTEEEVLLKEWEVKNYINNLKFDEKEWSGDLFKYKFLKLEAWAIDKKDNYSITIKVYKDAKDTSPKEIKIYTSGNWVYDGEKNPSISTEIIRTLIAFPLETLDLYENTEKNKNTVIPMQN